MIILIINRLKIPLVITACVTNSLSMEELLIVVSELYITRACYTLTIMKIDMETLFIQH